MTVPVRLATTALAAALPALAASAAAQTEEARSALSSIIVAKDGETRNPTTEIAVGFGDVSHISPWRLRRRFPRSVGERGGQPTTLRDALEAINKVVAADELANAKASAEVIEQFRGKKVLVFKLKKRKRYHRTQGHRQYLTKVKITSLPSAE